MRGSATANVLLRRGFYFLCYWPVLLYFTLFYRVRWYGARRVPREGPLLIVSNHQSHYDPPLVGLALRPRQAYYIARSGLFRNRVFAWLIRSLNAIPIRENEADTAAIRATVDQLNAGRAVLIFPEGSRTLDGALRPFKRGAWVLLRRARAPVLPVAIEGAFDVWPRRRALPRIARGRIEIAVGEPIDPERLLGMDAEDALEFLAGRVDELRLWLRSRLRHETRGRYPATGRGDEPFTTTRRDGPRRRAEEQ